MTKQDICQRYGEEIGNEIVANKEKPENEHMVRPLEDHPNVKLYLCWDQSYETEEDDEMISHLYEGFDRDVKHAKGSQNKKKTQEEQGKN